MPRQLPVYNVMADCKTRSESCKSVSVSKVQLSFFGEVEILAKSSRVGYLPTPGRLV